MRNETVAADGVYFASIIQDQVTGQTQWTELPMCDLGNGIWEVSFCGIAPGSYDYKFLNGSGGWEFPGGPPGPCNNPLDNNNRTVDYTAGGDLVEGPHCFSTCDTPCSGLPDPGGSENTTPTLSAPADITLDCNDALPPQDCLPLTDDCSFNCTSDLPTDDLSTLNPCGLGDIVRTWTGADVAGNAANPATQSITLEDNTPPVIDGTGVGPITINCANLPPLDPLPASDDCDALTQTLPPTDDLSGLDPTCGTGTITRTWIAEDCSGLQAMLTQSITIQDNSPPVIDDSGIGSSITVNCGAVPAPVPLPASDDCAAITDTGLPVDDLSGLDACGLGVITRSWSVSDCSGASSYVQTITVQDVDAPTITDPVPAPITINCGDALPVAITLAATDCDASITTTGLPVTDLSALSACGTGVAVRTWSVTDCSGLTTTVTQNITIQDNAPPTIIAPNPATLVVTCPSDIPLTNTLSASDLCDGSLTDSDPSIDDDTGLDQYGLGAIVRSWTATDCDGQSSTVTQTIVIDGIDPDFDITVLYCQADDVEVILPSIDLNGITGSWFPDRFTPQDLGVGSHVFDFEPDFNSCGRPTSIVVDVTDNSQPTFSLDTIYCIDDVLPRVLSTLDDNGLAGSWSPDQFIPATLGAGRHTFIFEPDDTDCTDTYTLTIRVDTLQQPILPVIGPYCSQLSDTIVLDSLTLNGIIGSWTIDTIIPSQLAADTFETVFIPQPGQCAMSDTASFIVADAVTASFASLGAFCALDINEYFLPDTSDNLLVGIWSIPSFTPAVAGNEFTSTFTPSPGQCAQPIDITFDVLSPTIPDFDPIGPLCRGNDTVLVLPTLSNNGIAGTWSIPVLRDIDLDSSRIFVTYTPDEGQCAITQTIFIDVNFTTIIGTFILCDSDEIRLENGNSNAVWTKDGIPIGTGSEYVDTDLDTSDSGEYCVTVDYGECVGQLCSDITVNAPPALVSNTTVCQGDSAYVQLVFDRTNSGLSVSTDIGIVIGNSTRDTFLIIGVTEGEVLSIEASVQGGFQRCIEVYPITVGSCSCPTPAIINTLTATDQEICLESVTQLEVQLTNVSSGTYSVVPSSGSTLSQNNLSASFSATEAGLYTIFFESEDPDGADTLCVAAIDSVVINVLDVPAPPLVDDNIITVCQDSVLGVLSAQGSNLTWYDSDAEPLPAAPEPSTATIGSQTFGVSQTVMDCESEIVFITVEVEACGCATPAIIEGLQLSASEICVGDTVLISIDLNDPALFGGYISSDVSVADGILPIAYPDTRVVGQSPGVVTIEAFTLDPDPSSEDCRPDTSVIQLTVIAAPPAPTISGTTSWCVGDTIVLPAASGTQTTWYNEDLEPVASPTVDNQIPGSYTFYATQTVAGCESDLSIPFSISVIDCSNCPDPIAVVSISTGGRQQFCLTDEGFATVMTAGPTVGGQWRTIPDDILAIDNSATDSIRFTAINVGAVEVWYVSGDPDGDGPCLADSAKIDLMVDQLDVQHEVQDIDCYSFAPRAIITVSGPANYSITPPEGTLLSGDTIIVGDAGTYDYTVSAGSCVYLGQFAISDLRYDETAAPESIGVTAGESLTLNIPAGYNPDQVIWLVDGEVFLDLDSLVLDISADEVTVDLTVVEGDCRARWQSILIPEIATGRPLKFFLPNIIAPDGPNSTFTLPEGAPYTIVNELSVYDRWGNVAYAVSNVPIDDFTGWDGRIRGSNASQGIYVYYMQATRDDGAVQTAFGNLTILR